MNKITTKLIAVIVLITLTLALGYTTYGAITVNKTLSSQGSVIVSPNLGIYSDSTCQTPLTTIDWGALSPGESVTKTVYIKNTGSGVSLNLSMSPSNWNPANVNNYMTLTWNPTNSTLAPSASTAATLTLTVSSDIIDITNFNVQVTIAGTQ
jgi:hypothetical protein